MKRNYLLYLVIPTLVGSLVGCKAKNEAPILNGANNTSLYAGGTFDARKDVTAFDKEDGDLTASIKISGSVDSLTPSKYTLTYSVTDSKKKETKTTREVTVLDGSDLHLANGIYNYKFADADTRHEFVAAAEDYLLDNLNAGIPFATQTSLTLFNERVTLPIDEYISNFGWGTTFASVSKDDKQVQTDNEQAGKIGFDADNKPGESGKKTYRTWQSEDYTTLNPYTYEGSVDSDWQSYVVGSFYTQALNASNNGWEFVPSLADGAPVPVNPTVAPNGKQVSKVWTIKLKSGLQWAYSAGVNQSALGLNHATLDVNDFIYSYRLSFDESWFRSAAGGGDFVTSKVKGAADYKNAVKAHTTGSALDSVWANVGLKKVDDLTLQVEFLDDKSLFDIYYQVEWPAISKEVYEQNPSLYGTDYNHIASSGLYINTAHEASVSSSFAKNTLHPRANLTQWTGQFVKIWRDGATNRQTAFQQYKDGKLDSVGIPQEEIENYKNDPKVLKAPQASTWAWNLNSFGSVQAQRATFPASTYVPEPILGHKNFRKALYYVLNRQDLLNFDGRTFPSNTQFSSAYYVEPEGGVPYRSTPQGKAVAAKYSGDTIGFNKDAALAYFKSALTEAIAAGEYTAGTVQNPTIITLDLIYMPGGQDWAAHAKKWFEQLIDPDLNVKIELTTTLLEPYTKLYDNMAIAEFDIAMGAISGAELDLGSFLDTYCSDGRTGFTMNWGFDSSVADINVSYNLNGKTPISETWSFDAIAEVLNGKIYVVDGRKEDTFGSATEAIEKTLGVYDLEGKTGLYSTSDGEELFEIIVGETLDEYAEELGATSVTAVIVTYSGSKQLFIIANYDGSFRIDDVIDLLTSADDIFQGLADANGITFVGSTGPLTSAQVASNEYLTELLGGSVTLEELIELLVEEGDVSEAASAYVEIWATTWDAGGSWDDAVAVINYNGIYVLVAWL